MIILNDTFMIQVNNLIALTIWTQSIHILGSTNLCTNHAKYQDDLHIYLSKFIHITKSYMEIT